MLAMKWLTIDLYSSRAQRQEDVDRLVGNGLDDTLKSGGSDGHSLRDAKTQAC